MRLLLDTHAFFWWLRFEGKLSAAVRHALGDSRNEILVSAVVAWELAAKARIGKWPEGDIVANDIEAVVADQGLQALPITIPHARIAGALFGDHRDPFDRMLAGQAIVEDATLVTADPVFRTFPVSTLW
jgi:PIN domain nuclease of toxin-antitoxin system